jgi:2-methylisocitrate lyase-like PEP mutase family enzyme
MSMLAPGAGLLIPGAANALTARLIEECGFKAVFVSGAAISNTFLGAPDLGLVTSSEMTSHIAAISEAVEIPIIADGDTGFGNALNVRRTVRGYESAGASVIQLEDQVFPKRCGHFSGKQIISTGEMVAKIKAACDARRSDGFLVMARTDSIAIDGYQAAIDRANIYREAGADLLFIEAPRTRREVLDIPHQVPGHHIVNLVFGGKTPILSRDDLAAAGFAGILYANVALQASLLAMQKVLAHVHTTGSTDGIEDMVMSFDDRQRAVRYSNYEELERRYAVDPEGAITR